MTRTSEIETCTVPLKHPGLIRLKQGKKDLITIGTFNIQKTQRYAEVIRIAKRFDVLFLQEFAATTRNILAMSQLADRAGLRFFSSPTLERQENTTGILISDINLDVVGCHEIQETRLHQDRTTDVRVRTAGGEHILFQTIYLPTGEGRSIQYQYINETTEGWIQLKARFPDLLLFFGGDFNHSLDQLTRIERRARLATQELAKISKTEDLASYDPKIRSIPTNKGGQNRRIS